MGINELQKNNQILAQVPPSAFTYQVNLVKSPVSKVRNVSTYVNDRITSIGRSAFYKCTKLVSISCAKVKETGEEPFGDCISLTTIDFPALTNLGKRAFYSCKKLTTVNIPQAQNIGEYAFLYCRSLKSLNLPQVTTINRYAFEGCYNLTSLTLGGSTVCSLSQSNAFSSTPIGGYSASAGTYGSIFVPASLLSDYQTAPNWSYFSNRIVGY